MQGFFGRTELAQVEVTPSLTAKCGACGLYKTCKSPKMLPTGKGRLGILVVAEAPGHKEDERGIQLVGESGDHVIKAFRKAGISMRDDCWLTNALICRPPKNIISDKRAIEYCRPNLIKTIKHLEPKVIILLGGTAVESLIPYVWKAGDIGAAARWVGWQIPSQKLNAWICPTYHPAYLMRMNDRILQYDYEQHLANTVKLTERPWKQVPDYASQVEAIVSPSEANAVLTELAKTPGLMAFDYETNALKPDNDETQIVTCSVHLHKRTIAFPWHGKIIETMKGILKDERFGKIASNCFSGKTKLLTKQYGVVKLKSIEEQTVTVLNHKKQWTTATIKSFGIQKTHKASFTRRNYTTSVWTTSNHNWIVNNSSVRLKTKELSRCRYYKMKNGKWSDKADQIPYLPAPKVVNNEKDYKKGIVHGIIYADGSKSKNRKQFYNIRLCGEKKELLPFLSDYTCSYPPSYNGDPQVYLSQIKTELKQLPQGTESDSYLIGFLRGLLATDGCVNHAGQISLSGTKAMSKWCKRFLPKVGYLFQTEIDINKYGPNEWSSDSPDYSTLYLSRESVQKEDILRTKHLKNYKEINRGDFTFMQIEGERTEEVFCAVVPDGSSFTLENGLVTGNCKFEDRWTQKHLGIRVRNWKFDTMLAAHALDGRGGITSIKFQAFVLLGQQDYTGAVEAFLKTTKGGNALNKIKSVSTKTLLIYNGLDSLLEYRVALRQAKLLGIDLK